VLVVVAFSIFSHGGCRKRAGGGMGPWLGGQRGVGHRLLAGGTTGYAINPARDLGPRLVHWLLPIPAKAARTGSYALIPIVGPLLGGALAGVLVRFAHL